jgi:release factor glutamine methyltransferase
MPTVGEALIRARQTLQDCSDSPASEARRLLAFVLKQPITRLYTHPDDKLSIDQVVAFQRALDRRVTGYPLAYILGEWGFCQWDFLVDEHVLIPRPETEQLVELAVEWANRRPADGLRVVDVGTGSGIIGVSLALLLPTASVLAVDTSGDALAVAGANAKRLIAENITFRQSDLLSNVSPQTFDLIAANLPYIDHDHLQLLDVARHEPHLALDGGPDGMTFIRRLLDQVPDYVQPGSLILLEIGDDQGPLARDAARSALPKADIQIIQDLNHRDRILRIDI